MSIALGKSFKVYNISVGRGCCIFATLGISKGSVVTIMSIATTGPSELSSNHARVIHSPLVMQIKHQAHESTQVDKC